MKTIKLTIKEAKELLRKIKYKNYPEKDPSKQIKIIYLEVLICQYEADKNIPPSEMEAPQGGYFTGEWNGLEQALINIELFVTQEYEIEDYKGERTE